MATMKMTGCMALVARMPQADQDALLARLDQYQADGIPAERAQVMATNDMLEELRAERSQIFSAIAEQFPDMLTVQEGGTVSTDASAADEALAFSRRQKPDPEKTVIAYKLFRVDPRKPGQLFPLFVNANDPVDVGVWLDADIGPSAAGGKVKSKLGPLAFRPGWHAGDVPIATHIGGKSRAELKAPDTRPDNQVWAEVEMAADRDWQEEANKRGTNKDGKLIAGKAHITDQIPEDGFYRYKTNANMTGNWIIGGSMKVNRILSDDEVKAINDAAGVADLPRETPFDAEKYGFQLSQRQTDTPEFKRWFGDSKVVDENGEPLVVYHGGSFNEADPRGFIGDGWFTASKEDAQSYAEQLGIDRITAVYLSVKNPRVVADGEETNQVVRTVDRTKYDGVYDPSVNDWIVWNPTQIKSAIGNSGAFDPENPDIRASQRQTDTPQFQRWFGDSKVVDENGEPLVVYRGEHGEDGGMDFQSRLASLSFGSKEVASKYAVEPNNFDDIPVAPRVFPVYLRIENPLINTPDDPFIELSEVADKLGQDVAEAAARKFAPEIEETDNWQENFADQYGSVDELLDERPEAVRELYTLAWRFFDTVEFVRAAQKAGYDGAIHAEYGIHSEEEEGAEYKVFDQRQVKSAIGNIGAFDPENPDIRASRRQVKYDKNTGQLDVGPGQAVRLSGLGRFGAGDDALAAYVPQRSTHTFALHPDKWVSTFYSLANKDAEKITRYKPAAVDIVPGTLVADMALANRFYRSRDEADARAYADSVKPLEDVDLSTYRMPELLIPKQDEDITASKQRQVVQRSSRQVDTPEFKRWFGDSKVVDENGEPLVVYHGMPGEMDGGVFRVSKYGSLGEGIYFTSDPEAAGRFATGVRGSNTEPKEQGSTVPAYLKMAQPFDDEFFVGNKDWQEWAASILTRGVRTTDPYWPQMTNWYIGTADESQKILTSLYDKLMKGEATLRDVLFIGDNDAEAPWGREILDQIKAHGAFDGVILKDSAKGFDEYVVYKPEQVKSAIGNSGAFDPENPDIRASRRERTPLGFYSALADSIDGIKTNSAPAQGWKDAIKGLVNKGQVKADEVEWSGINDWLDLQQGKVTREAVAQYLRDGGVRVEEVVLGQGRTGGRSGPENGPFSDVEFADNPRSKYAAYTLPGGENYREVLLTLPGVVSDAVARIANEVAPTVEALPAESIAQTIPAMARSLAERYGLPASEMQTALAQIRAGGLKTQGRYKSTHWDQPNVIAHIRVNDRTDADGKRVLFVEELQSDWGQEGKKKGFAGASPEEVVKRAGYRLEKIDGTFVVFDADGDAMGDGPTAELAARRAGLSVDGIPAAPFVTKTEGWLNLALKRVMVMAAEGGYDKVAFVNGEQSAQRYDLSKQIESIDASKSADGQGFHLTVRDKAGSKITDRRYDTAALPDVVGKEMADKIIKDGGGTYSGLDLKVGGEGMRAFYDSIVPLAVKKLLPKVGGGQMGVVTIDQAGNNVKIGAPDEAWPFEVWRRGRVINRHATRANAEMELAEFRERDERTGEVDPTLRIEQVLDTTSQQPSFDVTDAMREKVGEGLPMFSRRQVDTPQFKRWFGNSATVDGSGEPLRLYTGTSKDKDFDKFNIPKNGAWLTTNPDEASMYAKENDSRDLKYQDGRYVEVNTASRVLPVYARIEKPAKLSAADSEAMRMATNYKKVQGQIFDRLRAEGYDGVDMGNGVWVVIGSPNQIKSAIGNSGEFSIEKDKMNASRRQRQASGLLVGRDEVGRINFAPGAKAYDIVANIANKVLDVASMKPVSDELGRAMRNMKVEVERVQNQIAMTAEELAKIPQAEREMISDVIEGELRAGVHPPQHVLQVAASMQSIMSEQSAELVRLGMLSKEAASRWDQKYLPRFYESKLGDEVKAWTKAAKALLGRQPMMQGIRGNSLKARGMFETIDVADLPAWQAEGWEQRDPNFDPATSTQTVVWRDYTRKEREDMGEIRDAMFRFVMGYNASQRDVALGRLYESLAQNYASKGPKDGYVLVPDTKVEGTMAPRYGKLAGKYVPKEIMDHLSVNDESMMEGLFKIYRAGLAKWKEGKTVLNPVSHANNVISNITMAHFAGVSYWDAQKYAGAVKDLVTKDPMIQEAKDIGLFTGTFNQSELVASMPPQLRAMAGMSESKLAKMGEGVWDILAYTVSWNGKKYGVRPVMQWAYENEDLFFRYLVYRDARKRGMEPEDAREYAQQFLFTYDDLPKGARIVRDVGLPFFSYTYKVVPVLARTALEYPWRLAAPAAVAWGANAMMYAMAASMGGDEDDWWGKVLYRYATDPEFRERAKQLEAGERKNLPPYSKGTSAIGTPKAIRLGMDDVTGLPLFLDISKIFPGGDLFDATSNAGGVPLLQPITPSNPVLTIAVAMLANRDLFTGKDVVNKDTDTGAEAAQKRAAWLWKQASPAIAVGNYHFDRGMNVIANMTGQPITLDAGPLGVIDYTGTGRDGLPVQPKYAALQTVGIKVRPYDLDMSEKMDEAGKRRVIRELDEQIRRIDRLEKRGARSFEAADLERERLREKRRRVQEGLTVEGEEPK